MTKKRRPGMELPFNGPSSLAYNSISWLPIFHIERNLIMRQIRRNPPEGTLLDIGCGPGYLDAELIRQYPSLEVIGLDISQDMLKIAAQNLPGGNIKLIQGDAASLPLDNSCVDFIASSASMHHWGDVPASLREIYRVLKPGGRFLIMDIRRDAPELFYVFARIFNLFAPAELKRTRGAMGSLYTAYTPVELEAFLRPLAFSESAVTTGFAWMFATGMK